MSTITVDVEVEVTAEHLESAGFHHEDDCDHGECHAECHDDTVCGRVEAHETDAHRAADALHDWHETTHGYTIWSGCRQEPCNVLTLDYRKRT